MLKSLNRRSAANSRFGSGALAFALTLAGVALVLSTNSGASNPASRANAAEILVLRPAAVNKCTGCHGADLQGRKGFSPSITSTGVLRHYTKKSFEAVMATGATPRGGMVKRPMPVFHFNAKTSDALYFYLKTQK